MTSPAVFQLIYLSKRGSLCDEVSIVNHCFKHDCSKSGDLLCNSITVLFKYYYISLFEVIYLAICVTFKLDKSYCYLLLLHCLTFICFTSAIAHFKMGSLLS